MKYNKGFFISFLLLAVFGYGQEILRGQVVNATDMEGIHVFNKSLQKYTITNHEGAFSIAARVNDTIVFSAVNYELKNYIVYLEDFIHTVPILLKEKVNELDEVFIRPSLSGNLLVDTKNIKTEQPTVTSKSLHLPNHHVKKKVIVERKYRTSKSGIVDALINAINGRTKQLKKQLQLQKRGGLEDDVYAGFKDFIAHDYGIPKDKVYDFVFYAGEDSLFTSIVKTQNKQIILDFLKTKSTMYKKRFISP